MKMSFVVIILAIVSGCAGIGVPVTDDPDKKLAIANQLYDQHKRPIPAEKLIREAIDIYTQENNEEGLAEAYRSYGFFFRSEAVRVKHNFYTSVGFVDKSATYEGRYDKSIEYFEKAEEIFEKQKRYDGLINIHLNKGFTYEIAGKNDDACASFRSSEISEQNYRKLNGGKSINLPPNYSSYSEYVSMHKKRLNC